MSSIMKWERPNHMFHFCDNGELYTHTHTQSTYEQYSPDKHKVLLIYISGF